MQNHRETARLLATVPTHRSDYLVVVEIKCTLQQQQQQERGVPQSWPQCPSTDQIISRCRRQGAGGRLSAAAAAAAATTGATTVSTHRSDHIVEEQEVNCTLQPPLQQPRGRATVPTH